MGTLFFTSVSALEPVRDLAEGRIAALKVDSKCSHTQCMLRFFVHFCLALHPLIEISNRLLWRAYQRHRF
jgi:hypothetical protein